MKKKILTAFAILFSLCCLQGAAQAVIKFDKERHDFGQVEEGAVLHYTFEVYNIGREALLISEVKSDCGCAGVAFGDAALQTGQKDYITAVFYTEGRPGFFIKSLKVRSNATEPLKLIYVSGYVVPRAESAAYAPYAPNDESTEIFGVEVYDFSRFLFAPAKLKTIISEK